MPDKAKEGGTGKSVDVRRVQATTNQSPIDLEAEIAAAAKAIGEAKTVHSAVQTEAVKTPSPTTESTPVAKAQVVGHRHRTIQPISGVTPKAPSKEGRKEATTILVAAKKTAKLKPKSQSATVDSKTIVTPKLAPSQDNTEDNEPTEEVRPDNSRPDRSAVSSRQAGEKLDAISEELKNKHTANTKKASDEGLQAAKIYDTKKYHVPIKPNRHHRRAAVPFWLEVVIVIIGILTSIGYAIYADVIDIDAPLLSQNQTEQADAEQALVDESSSQAKVDTPPATKALGLIDYRSSFNRGDAELVFRLEDTTYQMAGQFTIDSDANLVLDMLTTEQQQQAEAQLSRDELKNLSYPGRSAFDTQLTIEYLANATIPARVTTGSLLGLATVLTDATHNDVAISFASELHTTNQACSSALRSFLRDYEQLDASAADTRQQVAGVIDRYNRLANACTDTSASNNEIPTTPLELVPEYTIVLEQSDSQVIVKALDTADQEVVNLTLSNLRYEEPLDAPIVTETTPEFVSTRFIDMVLLGQCDAQIFDAYQAGDDLSALAKSGDCDIIK